MPVDTDTAAHDLAQDFIGKAWRIRKLVLWLEAVIGLPMMLVGIALMRSAPDSFRTYLFLLGPFWMALPLVMQRLVTDRKRSRAVVLWIRRFHRGKRATVEQMFLEYVAADWGMLVTLSDTSVETDSATRMMVNWKYYALVSVLFGLVFSITNLGFFAGLLVGPVAFVIFNRMRLKKAGVDLSEESLKLTRMIERIRAEKMPGRGSMVLRCPRDGDLWRKVITDLSEAVDAVVVSTAESSAYVEWELQTLESSLGASKIINLIDGASPAPPLLAAGAMITVPAKMRWWPGERNWKSAALTLGCAILTRRR